MKSVMNHQFSQVPKAEIQRSSFDRSHGYKTTFDAGYLIPFYIDEALPGDTFNCRTDAFARLATPIKPVMDNMFMDTFFFAVPIRLIWDNWQKFNGEQKNPGDSTSFVVPQMAMPTPPGVVVGSLSDYFGIPTNAAGTFNVNSLWHRAYNLIWNEWFRDQNLQNSVVVDTDDGPDTYGDYVLLRRGKRHDYFTSCLPFPQKGPDVSIPLGSSAPVVTDGTAILLSDGNDKHLAMLQASATNPGFYKQASADSAPPAGSSTTNMKFGSNTGLQANLATATAATINALRQAWQLQRMYERDARGGTRYTEILKAHFGVTSPDARLQRPEYLGGGSSLINFHPVANTANAAAIAGVDNANNIYVGELAAFGTGSLRGHGFTKSFTEHCVLIGLVSVRADLTYQQGLDRMFSRRTRFDFYWPALSHLGEQSVLNQEIFVSATGTDTAVFGYQERFAEYRYKPSKITGEFRSTYPSGTLDFWHLSQKFTTTPTLSSSFIQEDPPVDRVIAVPSEPHFLFDAYVKLNCARPMPVYSVPGLVDHF